MSSARLFPPVRLIVPTLLVVSGVVGTSGCMDRPEERVTAGVRPSYDQQTGRLKELAYDANGNGRVDTWTEMDGTSPLRSRIDLNEDGKVDRWEIYGGDGSLVKVGFSRADDGKADAWVFAGPDGKVHRIEISSTGDERRIDRWEYYDATRAGRDGRGALIRAEEDTTHDGRPDRWETYEGGVLKTVAFDEDGNGHPDRRLTYEARGVLVVESQPDASGRFARRVQTR